MNLNDFIYEIRGYVKSIVDGGKTFDQVYSLLKESNNNPDKDIKLPSKSQWLRIVLDLENAFQALDQSKIKDNVLTMERRRKGND